LETLFFISYRTASKKCDLNHTFISQTVEYIVFFL
jgi:hypothetical protein